MSVPHLFEIDDNIQRILSDLPEEGDEYEQLEKTLDSLGMGREQLMSNLAHAIDNHSALEEMYNSNAYRLSNQARLHFHKAFAIRQYILRSMKRLNETRISTEDREIVRSPGPQRLRGVDVERLPDNLITKQADSSAILRMFVETGKLPDGVKLTESEVLAVKMK